MLFLPQERQGNYHDRRTPLGSGLTLDSIPWIIQTCLLAEAAGQEGTRLWRKHWILGGTPNHPPPTQPRHRTKIMPLRLTLLFPCLHYTSRSVLPMLTGFDCSLQELHKRSISFHPKHRQCVLEDLPNSVSLNPRRDQYSQPISNACTEIKALKQTSNQP